MVITHKLKMNLEEGEVVQRLEMPLGDVNSRSIQMLLYAQQNPWVIPDNIEVLIRYHKPDGTRGEYDTMPDGSEAWSIADNCLTIFVAPQVLTVAGTVELYAEIFQEAKVLHTFTVEIGVKAPFSKRAGAFGTSQDYYYVTNVLRGPVMAQSGQLLSVKSVDANGRAIRLEAVDLSELLGEKQNMVLYTQQSLSELQKERARGNIGAICMRDLRDGIEFEDGKTMGGYFNIRVFNSKLEGYDATKKKTYTFLTDADEERLINATLAALPVYNGEVSEA